MAKINERFIEKKPSIFRKHSVDLWIKNIISNKKSAFKN